MKITNFPLYCTRKLSNSKHIGSLPTKTVASSVTKLTCVVQVIFFFVIFCVLNTIERSTHNKPLNKQRIKSATMYFSVIVY